MSIFVIIIGIIIMILGVKKENKVIRNIGIVIALLGCLFILGNSSFISGVKGGFNSTTK